MRSLLWLGLLVLPLAQAQTVTPTLTVAPAAAELTIDAGQAPVSVNAPVSFVADGFACGPGAPPLEVAVEARSLSLTSAVSPAAVQYMIEPGVYASDPAGAAGPYNATAAVTVSVSAAPTSPNATVDLAVAAAFAGAEVMGCVPSTFAAAEGQAIIRVTVRAAPPPPAPPAPPSPPPPGGNATPPPPEGGEGNGIPLPAALAVLALAGVARRRRTG